MKNWCSMTVFDKKKKKKTLRDTTRFAFRETHFNLLIRFLFGRPGAVKVSNWYFLGGKKKKRYPIKQELYFDVKKKEKVKSIQKSLWQKTFQRGPRQWPYRYLVDPASSHMLVLRIKPCISQYNRLCTVKLRMAHYNSYSLFDRAELRG